MGSDNKIHRGRWSKRDTLALPLYLLPVALFFCALRMMSAPDRLPTLPRRYLPEVRATKVRYLSWKTRILLIEDFLSPAESNHIISLASKQMKRSVVDNIRTSSGTFIEQTTDAIMMRIGRRIAELSMLPLEHQEAFQVLHYGKTERYGAHMDTLYQSEFITKAAGLQRAATMLVYLNSPLEGGETVFPNIEPSVQDAALSPCAREGLSYKPQQGAAILFWGITPAGDVDMGATHGACPVISGEKWSMAVWIHQSPFKPCGDADASCEAWAKTGACVSHKSFMVSTPQKPGVCRQSCGSC